jgi:hypothetical protein
MKKALFGLFLIPTLMVTFTGRSASALSPAHPSCISYLQKINEANNSGLSASEIRQHLDGYKKICSGNGGYTEIQSKTVLSPAHPSCIFYLQQIKEGNNSGVNSSIIRQHLNKYEELCSDSNGYKETTNSTNSKPMVEKMVDGTLTITN